MSILLLTLVNKTNKLQITPTLNNMYIAVSGNIGSGKTTLVELLSKRLGFTPYFENIDNPYLDDFYKDMDRWAFNLQVCFLSKKLEQLFQILHSKTNIIQDRTIYEEAYIFVLNLKNMGLISGRDFDTYMDIFNLMVDKIPMPDVVIYLKSSVSTLMSQIYKRGREYEMGIDPHYLSSLNNLYDNWINSVYKGKVIVIEMDREDFVLHPELLDHIESQLKEVITL